MALPATQMPTFKLLHQFSLSVWQTASMKRVWQTATMKRVWQSATMYRVWQTIAIKRSPVQVLGLIGVLAAAILCLPKSAAQGYVPTYYTDIQPILEKSCVSCHVQGGIAPFALDAGVAAVKYAKQIARVVEGGIMPPYMPGADSPAFLNDPRLGVTSKQMILDWAKNGAPLGKPLPNQKP